ncbi:MAG: ferritin-like domain-containing protein [Deltaproteobacteria bacterium]|nr:ferritin-like domain-containing protein [Deltaproteobacteria bacterium]
MTPPETAAQELPLHEEIERVLSKYDTLYNWNYEVQVRELRELYEKAKRDQWESGETLKWDTSVDPESENNPDAMHALYNTDIWRRLSEKEIRKLRHHSGSWSLSQFLHGEQGALLTASQLVTAVPSIDAKFYASTQVMDEARHVEVFARYLNEKYELTYPISPHLKKLLDSILTESRWDFKYVGMQILVEGLALAAFQMTYNFTREPLVKDLTHYVMKDESRHVAFGVLSLKGYYDDMAASELRDREDWIYEACILMRDRFLMQEVWETLGYPKEECLEHMLNSPAMKEFRKILFSKIVPNLKRVGLLTPKLRERFRELDILKFEDWEATA